MQSEAQTFIVTYSVTHGEFSTEERRLLVARNQNELDELARSAMVFIWGGDHEPGVENPSDPDSITVWGGELSITLKHTRLVSLSTFIELRSLGMPAYCAQGLREPNAGDLDKLQDVSTALRKSLAGSGFDIPQVTMLNALAGASGYRNWNHFTASVVTPSDWTAVEHAAVMVQSATDDTGCEGGLTVTSEEALNKLHEELSKITKRVRALRQVG